ncbi:MAG: ribonuclease III [Gammaproteobacteria bacterium]
MSASLSDLESVLGYRFRDAELLNLALTHRSVGRDNNERLEFLGDAVLDFVVSTELYRRFPEMREDELTLVRAALVRKETLAEIARELSLGEYLRLSPGVKRSAGFRVDSILADALEAVVGAIYLDGGVRRANVFVRRALGSRLARSRSVGRRKDPKTRLQEYLQGRAEPRPEYRVINARDYEHDARFEVECWVESRRLRSVGVGANRRAAEQNAAEAALEKMGADDE